MIQLSKNEFLLQKRIFKYGDPVPRSLNFWTFWLVFVIRIADLFFGIIDNWKIFILFYSKLIKEFVYNCNTIVFFVILKLLKCSSIAWKIKLQNRLFRLQQIGHLKLFCTKHLEISKSKYFFISRFWSEYSCFSKFVRKTVLIELP